MSEYVPYDCEVMKYDKRYHKYLLNYEYMKNEYGMDFVAEFGSKTQAKNRMLKVSNRIYNHIYNHKLNNKRYWEYYLAFEENVRETIKKALIYQAMYEYDAHISELQNTIGINVLNGTKIKLEDLRGQRGIALEAENELRFYKNGLLIQIGKEFISVNDSTFNYDEMGY